MPATPAQVANDLEAQAGYFRKRDQFIADACQDSARMIRKIIAGEPVDGRTWAGLHTRLLNFTASGRGRADTQIAKSLRRGLATLTALRKDQT